jgi:hypothetical protein
LPNQPHQGSHPTEQSATLDPHRLAPFSYIRSEYRRVLSLRPR